MTKTLNLDTRHARPLTVMDIYSGAKVKNNRWGVYKVKSRAKDSQEKALSLATAGKDGPKAKKAGQSMGGRVKGPLKQSEHDMQVAVIDWCRANERRWSALKLIYAIPNGGHRHIATAMKLKKEGVKAGVPDLHLPVWSYPGGGDSLWIEMKAKGGKVSPVQEGWHVLLRTYGHKVVVCWTAEDAIKAITDYLEG